MNKHAEMMKHLARNLREADREIRENAPVCARCGKPTAGLIFGDAQKESAGLCICPAEDAAGARGMEAP